LARKDSHAIHGKLAVDPECHKDEDDYYRAEQGLLDSLEERRRSCSKRVQCWSLALQHAMMLLYKVPNVTPPTGGLGLWL
jgi:hypothetical protein